jgi:hypothetical protein
LLLGRQPPQTLFRRNPRQHRNATTTRSGGPAPSVVSPDFRETLGARCLSLVRRERIHTCSGASSRGSHIPGMMCYHFVALPCAGVTGHRVLTEGEGLP